MLTSVIFRSAIKALKTNILRTGLTMLGIIIGITSVILISSVGQGAVAFVTDELSTFGTNFFSISPGSSVVSALSGGGEKPLTLDDVETLEDADISNIENIAPFSVASRVVSANGESETITVYGMTETAESLLKPNIVHGDFLSDVDGDSHVAVLGIDVAEELFGVDTNPVGESVKIEDIRFRVIGVSESDSSFFGSFFNTSVNIPLEIMHMHITGEEDLLEIDISVYNTDYMNETMDEVELILRDSRDIDDGEDNDFIMVSMEESLSTVTKITDLLTAMIAGISAISLLVGGVSVMNIMLVSVTERTKEIGLLKAIGAKKKDILSQFLIESVVMTTIGGFAGILLGLIGTYFVAMLASIPFVISPMWVLMAAGMSSMVGVVFGVFPARKAANLSPIDALRHE
jgi:putative ABC transport system permease protein